MVFFCGICYYRDGFLQWRVGAVVVKLDFESQQLSESADLYICTRGINLSE